MEIYQNFDGFQRFLKFFFSNFPEIFHRFVLKGAAEMSSERNSPRKRVLCVLLKFGFSSKVFQTNKFCKLKNAKTAFTQRCISDCENNFVKSKVF